jgi:hypothetical protein
MRFFSDYDGKLYPSSTNMKPKGSWTSVEIESSIYLANFPGCIHLLAARTANSTPNTDHEKRNFTEVEWSAHHKAIATGHHHDGAPGRNAALRRAVGGSQLPMLPYHLNPLQLLNREHHLHWERPKVVAPNLLTCGWSKTAKLRQLLTML